MQPTQDLALPILKPTPHTKRRWIVLISVQALIIAHVLLWYLSKELGWFGGKTITPIEPSEGMEFVKNGIINAGAIFFVVAILSTLIFGRWFCGWACHIVLLQDMCYWILRKMHIRPKPFRARLLMWFPFALAMYMFAWPVFYRLVLAPTYQPDLSPWKASTHLVTANFWSTFAPPLVAIPFLLVCGFATVYVLGAKGFCTYGCPYAGFFKPIDNLAPMRVRVNENCQQCGKCTAACTSNVRVHEEVHLYKMVIDSGCMKTMSCIDACPNDALSIGFGTNAVKKRTKPKTYDLSLNEELCIALFFLFAFFAFRGLYASVPMLMSVGMSLVVTWALWKAVKVLTSPNVSFHKTQLKFHGKINNSGRLYFVVSCLLLLFTMQSATITGLQFAGNRATSNGFMDKAIQYYQLAGPMSDGGIGFASNPNMDAKLAKLHEYQGNYAESEKLLKRVVSRVGDDQRAVMLLGQVGQFNHSFEQINLFYVNQLNDHPEWSLVWEDYVAWLKRGGAGDASINASMKAISFNPHASRLLIQHALVQIEFGNPNIAVELFNQMTINNPHDPNAWMMLAQAQNAAGDHEGSRASVEKANQLIQNP